MVCIEWVEMDAIYFWNRRNGMHEMLVHARVRIVIIIIL